MKLLIILFIALTAVFSKCNSSSQHSGFSKIDSLSLSVRQYPMPEVFMYRFDTTSLKVKLINKTTGLDSLLFQKAISFKDFELAGNTIKKFNQDRYSNKCIEDGQVLSLNFTINDSIFRKISFSNYYNQDLEKLINFINANVDTQLAINYDKNKLIHDIEKCK